MLILNKKFSIFQLNFELSISISFFWQKLKKISLENHADYDTLFIQASLLRSRHLFPQLEQQSHVDKKVKTSSKKKQHKVTIQVQPELLLADSPLSSQPTGEVDPLRQTIP